MFKRICCFEEFKLINNFTKVLGPNRFKTAGGGNVVGDSVK